VVIVAIIELKISVMYIAVLFIIFVLERSMARW